MPQEKIVLNLPRHFNCQVNEMVDTFTRTHPVLNPPHVRNIMAYDDHVYDPSFGLMGLMQEVDGNPTNPIQATKELQHVMDIRPWCPCVLPKAFTTSRN